MRRKLEMEGEVYEPVGMKGWDEVVFASESGGKRRSVHIDALKNHLDVWERNG